jgi:hypothetical protein
MKGGNLTKNSKLIFFLSIASVLALSSCNQQNYLKNNTPGTVAASTGEKPIVIKDYSDPTKSDSVKSTSDTGIITTLQTYKDGNISIQYPNISDLKDKTKEDQINSLLKSNALEVLKAYTVDSQKDSISIEAKVISADQKRITVLYSGLFNAEGAAHPLNIFFTNTVDLNQVKDIGLVDYADPETLAKYVLSDECRFYDASPELAEALMEARTQIDMETYTKIFQQADFPIKASSPDGTVIFPDSFSYEDKGTIIFSIPVPHALGDYALISYTPETK